MAQSLQAGVGRVDITPPLPIDLIGYSRRWQPASEVRAPLTATALIVDDSDQRVVLIGLDIPIIRPQAATKMRQAVAQAVGTTPESILINVSHTHAGPHTHTGGIKIGGDQRDHSDNELAYIDQLPGLVVESARVASQELHPVRVGASVGSSDLGVNRRERAPDGRTILGWNPEEYCDRDVGVLRVDRDDGSPLAIVVNYACHPVVVGPEDLAVNPDFPGPMRDFVERATGATCLFLQGAGGNVLPLQGFFDHSGPEVVFGERLGVEALHTAAQIESSVTEIKKLDYGSVTPISLYRRTSVDPQPDQALGVATRVVDLPLKDLPTTDSLELELDKYRRAVWEAQEAGAGREVVNPLEYHVNWAEEAMRILKGGDVATTVPAFLQAIRIGDSVIAAVPGEVFSEIARQVKDRSPATTTLFAGYSNGVISYLPTAAEYPYGGYECDYAHHSYGLVEQVAPATEGILVEGCSALIEELFADR